MSWREKLRLYVITDRKLCSDEVKCVEAALRGGATSVQLRLKEAPTSEIVEVGKKLRKLTRDYDALLFVNDRVDVALAIDADGVQLGIEDMPIADARRIAPHLIIGGSVYSLEEAIAAEKAGADYLGVGAVFPTSTKKDSYVRVIGLEGLRRIVEAARIPVVAIGGINLENAKEVLETKGIAGIAVVSAVMGAPDPEEAARMLRAIVDRYLG
uniref:Thiamine-phosphate synthase n=1 Tax=Fervidicoccus fontis TaxID=683846 RepID=A0A7J3ZM81_9CREN